ncbi:hypothetical protein D4R71_02045 [bacterium]|nr:MAG: hypothetical protein D4R71_02045 [bacterium]
MKKVDKATKDFMLAEFHENVELWRHTDKRIESSINFYLAFSTVLFPGLVLLYKEISNIELFIVAALPAAFALFMSGYLITRRITTTDILKSQYILSINLARSFFAKHEPGIAHYLINPIAQPADDHKTRFNQVQPRFHSTICYTIYFANSILLGGTVSCIIRFFFLKTFNLLTLFLVGLVVCISCFITLIWSYLIRIKSYKEKQNLLVH